MKKEYLLPLFLLLICVQIAVPLMMIGQREAALNSGIAFRFKTAPVDPFDAFRGRYVALRTGPFSVPAPQGAPLQRGQKVFAQLTIGEDGFATVASVSLKKPSSPACMTATVNYAPWSSSPANVSVDLPIDRYYMEEKAAPKAEKLYQEHSRRGAQDAYVTVRVKDCFAVVDGLFVADRPIEDLVRGQ